MIQRPGTLAKWQVTEAEEKITIKRQEKNSTGKIHDYYYCTEHWGICPKSNTVWFSMILHLTYYFLLYYFLFLSDKGTSCHQAQVTTQPLRIISQNSPPPLKRLYPSYA
jgi:hypothetical protein